MTSGRNSGYGSGRADRQNSGPGSEEHIDAIVVGAGIAGSLVAKRLGERGWRVLVVEAGLGDGDQGHERAVDLDRYRSAPAKVPGAAIARNPLVPSPDMPDLGGTPGGGYLADGYFIQNGPLPYSSGYLRVNGGTGTAWTGLTPRMHPEDFRTGALGYGRDWPIGYDELEPYYRAAERELGVAGDLAEQREHVNLPFAEGYSFPHRPVPASHLDRMLAERLDGQHVQDPSQPHPTALRVVGTPQARNSSATDEHGPVCEGSASCIPICPTGAKYTPRRTQDRWAPGVTLLTRAVVDRLLTDPTGRITGVEYQRYDDPARPAAVTRRTVRASVVVLAAHAIENARLLLASGVANSSDQVGRNLMDHPVLLTWGLMPERTGPYRGPGSTAGLEGFRFGPARAVRAPFRVEIGNWGWVWAVGPPDHEVASMLRQGDPAAPDGRGLFGAALRQALGDRVGRQFAFQFEMEQSADPANRVTLDHRNRDPLGSPRPVLTYDVSDHVKRGMAAAKAVSDQIFALAGAEDHSRYEPGPFQPGWFEYEGRPYAYRGAGHGAGTHIMGEFPADSVVDSWQRCWDHPNLYAVGCGSMPSLGTSNPTLTMAAITLRSAERIHRDLTELRDAVRLRSPATTARTGPAQGSGRGSAPGPVHRPLHGPTEGPVRGESRPMAHDLTLPPVAAPYQLPFHYGALHNIGLDYLVDPGPVRDMLAKRHPDLTAADFGGRACVTVNYQLYFAQYPNGGGITQEIEYSIIAHPTASGDRLARLSYEEFAQGFDQTKLLGIARLHVLCDNPLAIEAGTLLFGEPKYPAWFESVMPSPNGPAGDDTWTVTCKQAVLAPSGDGLDRRESTLFSFEADLRGLPRLPVNNTPITGYGTDPTGRPLAGPLNVYQPYQYLPLADGAAERVRLRVHDASSEVGTDLATLIGDAPAAGAWTYQSPPVAAHNRPYYVPRAT
nr:GMC family oxidoreductase [Streptomyces sp. NBC_00857]